MKVLTTLAAMLLACAFAPQAQAARLLDCEMRFSMSGWSAFYKTSSGTGTVSCNNGQRMQVKIASKGGGISFGKSRIVDGRGEFSGIQRIEDVLGTYVTAEAHAGAVKSTKAQVMTKGEVSLALGGKGEGWDVGVAFGKFTISR
ncbi:hypothetical protein ACFFGH_02865 [Lysobacter korlensis]|uniref:Secreted protein n=1 Tax=Lysobacter korlensis TaxID=553636 RepID=A0ABV6RJP3_9GAMM